MSARLRVIVVAVGLSLPAAGRGDEPGAHGTQVVTGETLRRSGLTRLGDLFLLADFWEASTIEGFAWQTSPHGLAPLDDPDWVLLIDGRRVDLGPFDVRTLNRLPLSIDRVDRVEFMTVPVQRNGHVVTGGLVHIHTRRPAPGPEASLRAATGSETGDPGPLRFTKYPGLNVERLGFEASGATSFGGRHGFLEASFIQGRHYAGDPEIVPRYAGISLGQAEARVFDQESASLRTSLEIGRMRHDLILGGTNLDEGWFLEPYGREIPVENRWREAAVNGAWAASVMSLGYEASGTIQEVRRRPNAFDLDPDWKESSQRVGLWAETHRGSASGAAGLAWKRIAASSRFLLTDPDAAWGTMHASGRWDRGAHAVAAAVALSRAGDRAGFRAFASGGWSPAARHRLEPSLSYTRSLPEEDGRIWFWRERGYGFLEASGVVVTGEALRPTERTAADLAWRAGDRVGVAGFVRRFSGLTLEDEDYRFDPATEGFSSPVRLLGRGRGTVAGGSLAWTPVSRARGSARLLYRYQEPVAGDAAFRRSWRSVPRHELRGAAEIETAYGVGVGLRVRARSRSTWDEYRTLEADSEGRFSGTLPAHVAVDVTLERAFWRDRFHGSLSFRNLLNQRIRPHPIAGENDLTLVVQIRARTKTPGR